MAERIVLPLQSFAQAAQTIALFLMNMIGMSCIAANLYSRLIFTF